MIKSLKLDVFAGIQNKHIHFEPGLNVIYGPNEAGKSTCIEALYGLLFIDEKLTKRRLEDKQFAQRAFPYNEMAFAAAELAFVMESQTYRLQKKWHHTQPQATLRVDNQVMASYQEVLEGLLGYGEGTYQHIIFTKQDHLKQIFERVKDNRELTENMQQLLENTQLALDGLNVEAYREKLSEAWRQLVSNWDIERQRPAGNRGIDSPHKRNIGDILTHYYAMTTAEELFKHAEQLEHQREGIQKKWFHAKEELEAINKRLAMHEGIEKDVRQRGVLDMEKSRHLEAQEASKKINSQWPIVMSKIEENKREQDAIKQLIQDLKGQRAYAKAYAESLQELDKAKRVKGIHDQIMEKKEALLELASVDADKVAQLETNEKQLHMYQTMLEASRLRAHFKRGHIRVKVTDAFGKIIEAQEGMTVESPAFLSLAFNEDTIIDIRSCEVDYDGIIQARQALNEKQDALFMQAQVVSLAQAKEKWQRKQMLMNDLKALEKQLQGLPSEDVAMAVIEKAKGLVAPELTRDEAEKALESALDRLKEIDIALVKHEQLHEQWTKAYGSPDALLEGLIGHMEALKDIDEALSGLAPLPQHFQSADMFLNALEHDRRQHKEVMEVERQLELELVTITGSLPDKSAEGYKEDYEKEKALMLRAIEKAKKLASIMRIFEESIEAARSHQKSFFEEQMVAYVNLMTQGKYDGIHVNAEEDVLALGLPKPLPMSLLSSGTLDALALAFKLSMSEALDKRWLKLTVLDDCLVNMDHQRRLAAIKAISEHAKTHQVIFTTCHEDIAKSLGGHLITL